MAKFRARFFPGGTCIPFPVHATYAFVNRNCRLSSVPDMAAINTIPGAALIRLIPLLGLLRIAAADAAVTQIIAHRGASAERPESTLAAIERAIETGATAVEVDVRTSRDGRLFLLHDSTLDRTTNGAGKAGELTLAELQQLDAGAWFDPAYRGARIPSLIEAARTCRGRIDLLLDLKEDGDEYDRRVAEVIRRHCDPARTILGVRSVAQARRFRELHPQARQLALIPNVDTIEDFAAAGVDTIRLWPRWLEAGDEPARRVRATGKRLHLNGTLGGLTETREMLRHNPDSLLSDHPQQLRDSLTQIAAEALIEAPAGTQLEAGVSRVGTKTFLNRDYHMTDLPAELAGKFRYAFKGGSGDQVRIRFRQPAVIFAAFEYNRTGAWSFADGRPPDEFGWHLWRPDGYAGTSNKGRTTIWFREYRAGQELANLPAWWLCLAIVDPLTAGRMEGFRAGLVSETPQIAPLHSHVEAAADPQPLSAPPAASVKTFQAWQEDRRARFVEQMLYPYEGRVEIAPGRETQHPGHRRREFQVTLDGRRLFRFFRLQPETAPRAAIVCFMGHGKVSQILDEPDSYQHACATRFADAGHLVFAMENIGMEPGTDTHLDLDQSLRLDGHGWYGLLFAHQRILLDHVFADPQVPTDRVAVAGVSTGGLLALSAAAMEPRIAAASVQGIFGSMRVSFIRDRRRHCKCGAIPRLLPDFDLPELALLIAPRALHIANGRTDGFSPEEAGRCVDLVTPWFKSAGGNPPRFTISPGGHEFAFDTAQSFFTEQFTK